MSFRFLSASILVVLAAAPAVLAHDGHNHTMGGGEPGDPGKVDRTVEVTTVDNSFSLKSLEVKDGETVRFVVRNDGLDPHEFLIGVASEHAEHRQLMKAMLEQQKKGGHAHDMSAMEHQHASGVTAQPGKTGSFVWTFASAPDLEFACDIPGHYEDGMHGPITFTK
jgi:uncharacterized cupredoxin-like copper-binding protein